MLAPNEILPHAKRVIIYLFRARPGKLLEDLMAELQTVESLNWLVERTEIPPFYRLSHLRKTSSYSDTNVMNGGLTMAYSSAATNTLSKPQTSELEKGMIHTKRRSAEESSVLHHQQPHCRSSSSGTANLCRTEKTRTISGPAALPDTQFLANERARYENEKLVEGSSLKPPEKQRCPSSETINAQPPMQNHLEERDDTTDYGPESGDGPSKLVPLPMPEYGGYYAPLKEFLPPQPAATFHRCSIALMFLTEIVNEGAVINIAEDGSKKEKKLEWCSAYLPLMVHIAFLSLDHVRPMVHLHGYNTLINLLVVAGAHKDHFSISKILLNQQTKETELELYTPGSGLPNYDFLGRSLLLLIY